MIRKWLAIGIILLFVGVTIAPTINANNDKIVIKPFSTPKKEDTVSITVLEYRPDGTIGKSVIQLSKIQAEKLRTELNNVRDLGKRLSIYKKYNLIPQDITVEKLRLGMEEKAQRLGFTKEKLQKYITHYTNSNRQHYFFCMNFKSMVEGASIYGLRFLGGTSFATSVINAFIFFFGLDIPFRPSKDLFQTYVSFMGVLKTYNGTLPDSDVSVLFQATFLFGFVGYVVGNLPLIFITDLCEYLGYAVASICFGLVPFTGPYPPL
jgi:hypothetical protein